MGLQKNVSSQKWLVFAFDTTTNEPVTSDAANITAKIRKDYGSATAVTDTNPTEIEDGYYEFDLTQAETNANVLDLLPESSSSDVQVIGVPARIFTVPAGFADLSFLTADQLTTLRAILGVPSSGTTPDDPTTGILDTIRDAVGVVDGIVDSILVDTGTTLDTKINTIDTVVDAIKVVTDDVGGVVWDHAITGYEAGPSCFGKTVTVAASDVAANNSTLGTVDDNVNAIKVTTDKLDDTLELDSTVYRFTTNALEQGPSGGGSLTAADVWSYSTRALTDKAGFTISGTLTTLDALDTAQDSQHSTTQGLVTTVDTVVDTINSKVDTIDGIVDSILVDTGTTLDTKINTIDGIVDAIKVTTDKLDDTLEDDSGTYRFTQNALEEGPSGGGSLTAADVWTHATRSLTDKAGFTISGTLTTLDALDTAQDSQHSTTQGLVTTVDGVVDTINSKVDTIDGIVDSILVDTGTTLDTKINTIDGLIDTIKITTDKLDDTLEDDSGTYRFTTNALEQGPSGGSLTAEDVWTYSTRALTDKAGFTISGTITTLDSLDLLQDNQHAITQGAISTIDAVVDNILIDTDTTIPGLINESVYYANINVIKDTANDEYTVQWFKDDAPVTTGITSPTLQVVKRADGSDLISSSAMTHLTSGIYKLDSGGGALLTGGDTIIIIASATIDGSTRTFRRIIGRDTT